MTRHVPIRNHSGFGFWVWFSALGFSGFQFWVSFGFYGFGSVLGFGQFWVWFWDSGFGCSLDFNLVMQKL